MTDVADAKSNIQIQDVQYKSSVSEAVGNKIAASINFVNNRQYDTHSFNLNGRYKLGESVLGADGIFPCLFDMEIVGVTMFNRVAGTSGTTELDIQWLDESNSNQGSIFSTTPKIDNTAAGYSYLIKNVLNDTDVELPVGAVSPILSKTEFNAGDALFLNITQAMGDAEDCSLLIHFRPR